MWINAAMWAATAASLPKYHERFSDSAGNIINSNQLIGFAAAWFNLR